MEQQAIVVASCGDHAARYLLPAAREAVAILQKAGYIVKPFLDGKDECAGIYTHLMESCRSGRTPLIGFLSAHGSDEGLHERRGGPCFIDRNVCKLMEGSVLLVQACLQTGKFPETCTTTDKPLRAIVGYQPKLFVPPRQKWWDRLFGHAQAQSARTAYDQCILLSLKSLLRGASVREARLKAASAWDKAATSFVRADKRLAVVYEANARSIKAWGDLSARLPRG